MTRKRKSGASPTRPTKWQPPVGNRSTSIRDALFFGERSRLEVEQKKTKITKPETSLSSFTFVQPERETSRPATPSNANKTRCAGWSAPPSICPGADPFSGAHLASAVAHQQSALSRHPSQFA